MKLESAEDDIELTGAERIDDPHEVAQRILYGKKVADELTRIADHIRKYRDDVRQAACRELRWSCMRDTDELRAELAQAREQTQGAQELWRETIRERDQAREQLAAAERERDVAIDAGKATSRLLSAQREMGRRLGAELAMLRRDSVRPWYAESADIPPGHALVWSHEAGRYELRPIADVDPVVIARCIYPRPGSDSAQHVVQKLTAERDALKVRLDEVALSGHRVSQELDAARERVAELTADNEHFRKEREAAYRELDDGRDDGPDLDAYVDGHCTPLAELIKRIPAGSGSWQDVRDGARWFLATLTPEQRERMRGRPRLYTIPDAFAYLHERRRQVQRLLAPLFGRPIVWRDDDASRAKNG